MRWWAAALLALGLASAVSAQGTNQYRDYPLVGYVLDSARAQLERAWDDTNPNQVERAYCVTRYTLVADTTRHMRYALVSKVAPAPDSAATPVAMHVTCPPGEPYIHVHTPTTCAETAQGTAVPGTCMMGGMAAWECEPSRVDWDAITSDARPFSVIQCARHVFVFWWAALAAP